MVSYVELATWLTRRMPWKSAFGSVTVRFGVDGIIGFVAFIVVSGRAGKTWSGLIVWTLAAAVGGLALFRSQVAVIGKQGRGVGLELVRSLLREFSERRIDEAALTRDRTEIRTVFLPASSKIYPLINGFGNEAKAHVQGRLTIKASKKASIARAIDRNVGATSDEDDRRKAIANVLLENACSKFLVSMAKEAKKRP